MARTRPLPPNWSDLRRHILQRDNAICHVCLRPGADQVDHLTPVVRGGTDHPDNLAAIHASPCHGRKSGREAHGPPRRRPPEPHPGQLA